MDSTKRNIIVGAAAATASLVTLSVWIFAPRKPYLSESVADSHFTHLEHTEEYPVSDPNWKPPHMKTNIYTERKSKDLPVFDIVIVGSGLGGLTVASLLCRRGYSVCVLEQHDQAGGCLHTFAEKGYEFDVGLHYIGGDVGNKWSPLRKAFDAVTGGRVEWCKMEEPYDKAVCSGEYQPAETFSFYGDYNRTRDELIAGLEGEENSSRSIKNFFASLDTSVARMGGWLGVKVLPPLLRTLLSPFLTLLSRGVMNTTTTDFMSYLGVRSTRVHGVLTYLFGDYGLGPHESAWGVHAAVFGHWKGGAYYPYGGSSALAMGACEVVRMNGGKIFVKARVKEIVVEGGGVKGVQMEKGGFIRGKIVVSDAGARNTYLNLLSPKTLSSSSVNKSFVEALKNDGERDLSLHKDGLAPSCTLLNLFCGLDDSAENLGIPAGNAWVVPGWDHKDNFEKFSEKGLEAEIPVTFIGSNSAKDESYKKRFGPNRGSIMVLAPVEYKWFAEWENGRVHARGGDYDAVKSEWTSRLEAKLYQLYPQLEGHVVYKDLGTPLSNNHYLGVQKGEVYGLTHSLDRTWRYSDDLSAQTNIKGLYLTGQDLMSAGVSAALMGGIMTTASISKWAILTHLHNLA